MTRRCFSQLLHGLNLISSPYRAFHLPPITPIFNCLQGGQLVSPTRVGKEEVIATTKKQLPRKMKGRPTKKKNSKEDEENQQEGCG